MKKNLKRLIGIFIILFFINMIIVIVNATNKVSLTSVSIKGSTVL